MKLLIKNKFTYSSHIISSIHIITNRKEYSIYNDYENIIIPLRRGTIAIVTLEQIKKVLYQNIEGIFFLKNNNINLIIYD